METFHGSQYGVVRTQPSKRMITSRKPESSAFSKSIHCKAVNRCLSAETGAPVWDENSCKFSYGLKCVFFVLINRPCFWSVSNKCFTKCGPEGCRSKPGYRLFYLQSEWSEKCVSGELLFYKSKTCKYCGTCLIFKKNLNLDQNY